MFMRKHGVVYLPPDGTSRYLFVCACHWNSWTIAERKVHTDSWGPTDLATFNYLCSKILPWTANEQALAQAVDESFDDNLELPKDEDFDIPNDASSAPLSPPSDIDL